MAHLEFGEYPIDKMARTYYRLKDEFEEKLTSEDDPHYDNLKIAYDVYKSVMRVLADSMKVIGKPSKNMRASEEQLLRWKQALETKRDESPYGYGNSESEQLLRKHHDYVNQLSERLGEYLTHMKEKEDHPIWKVETEKQENYEKYQIDLSVEKIEQEKQQEKKQKEAEKAKIIKITEKYRNRFINLENRLTKTNSILQLTKQSNQFRDFRKSVNKLNTFLDRCNGMITDKLVPRVAKIIVELEQNYDKYLIHCRKHPSKSGIRLERMNLASELMKQVGFLKGSKKILAACNDITSENEKHEMMKDLAESDIDKKVEPEENSMSL